MRGTAGRNRRDVSMARCAPALLSWDLMAGIPWTQLLHQRPGNSAALFRSNPINSGATRAARHSGTTRRGSTAGTARGFHKELVCLSLSQTRGVWREVKLQGLIQDVIKLLYSSLKPLVCVAWPGKACSNAGAEFCGCSWRVKRGLSLPSPPAKAAQQLQLPGLVSPGMLEQGRGVRFMLWGKMSAAGS